MYYENKIETVMVINSTNINKTNNFAFEMTLKRY